MSAISNFMTCGGRREPAVNCIDKKNLDFGLNWRATSSRTRISMPFQKNEFQLGTEGKSSRGNKEKRSIRMALVDERVVYGRDTAGRPAVLAYDLVQVPLVKWGSVTAYISSTTNLYQEQQWFEELANLNRSEEVAAASVRT